MVRSAILFFALISSAALSARTISGTVLAAADSTAITGANCRLSSNTTFLTGTSTDSKGGFFIETDVETPLLLEITLTGYNPAEILIESIGKGIDIGTVYLNESLALGNVTVTANSTVDARGHTIVFPSASDIKASATSISLFQKLPLAGLDANPINRSLSVDGGTPMILINGIPSSMDDVNALQPKDIEKIEFSRITPARYADRGTTGLISITLKQRKDGGQIYGWGRSAVTTTFVDANIHASYHQGPSQFSLYYSPSWRNYQKVFDNTTESYIGDDFRVDLEEHDRNPFNYSYHQMRLKYDYSPNTSTLLSATFSASPSQNKSRSIAHTIDSQTGEYDNFNFSGSHDFTPSLDLFLRHDFNERNSLEAQVVGTLSSSDYRRDNNYIFTDGNEESYIMNVDSRRRSLISEISYIHDFSDRTQLSAGFQNTVSRSTNTYLSTGYKPVLTENNNYVYVRLGQQIGKVYMSLSTGAKLFWIKNDLNKRHFVRNISTVQASWNIDRKWNLVGAFQYSPSIPSLTALTDYPQQTTPYLLSNGNPDLKVAEFFTYQIMPSYRFKKFNGSLLLSLNDMKDRVINNVTYLGDGQFLSQSVNSKSGHVYRASLNLKLSDIHGFGVNLNLGMARYECSGPGWKHTLNSFSGSMSLWWNKGPYTISYWRKIPGKYLSGHYVGKDENGDALSFEYQPDSHWTFGASWMYMFDRKGTRYPAWDYSTVNPSYRERHIENNSNMVVLSVSYSADFGSIFRTARRNLNNSDSGSSLLKM